MVYNDNFPINDEVIQQDAKIVVKHRWVFIFVQTGTYTNMQFAMNNMCVITAISEEEWLLYGIQISQDLLLYALNIVVYRSIRLTFFHLKVRFSCLKCKYGSSLNQTVNMQHCICLIHTYYILQQYIAASRCIQQTLLSQRETNGEHR